MSTYRNLITVHCKLIVRSTPEIVQMSRNSSVKSAKFIKPVIFLNNCYIQFAFLSDILYTQPNYGLIQAFAVEN